MEKSQTPGSESASGRVGRAKRDALRCAAMCAVIAVAAQTAAPVAALPGAPALAGAQEASSGSYGQTSEYVYSCDDAGVTIVKYTGEGGTVSIPATIEDKQVVAIAANAFDSCAQLTGLTIPEGVETIGDEAFCDCAALASIQLPQTLGTIGKSAFLGCTSLASVDIPAGVTSVGDWAFRDCTSLAKATFAQGATAIGYGMFYGCTALEQVDIPASVGQIGGVAFRGCSSLATLAIPAGVTLIGQQAFADCVSLASVAIPDSVTSIGYRAFHGCSNLGALRLSSSLQAIGAGAFSDCAEGFSLSGPRGCYAQGWARDNGVTYVPDTALVTFVTNCDESLASQELPCGEKVAQPDALSNGEMHFLGWYTDEAMTSAFSFNTALSDDVTLYAKWVGDFAYEQVEGGLEIVGYYGDGGDVVIPGQIDGTPVVSLCANLFYGQKSLTSVTLPASVKSVGDYAFGSCRNLVSVVLPEGVETIGDQAFYNCTSLASVQLPSTLTQLGWGAFQYCSALKTANVPGSVEVIDHDAFYGCTALTSIDLGVGIKTIARRAFYGCTALTSVEVPQGVQAVCESAFSGNSSLVSVVLGEGVQTIEEAAFYRCEALASVSLPSTLKTIGVRAFQNDSALVSVTLPEGLESIGRYAFMYSGLQAISIPGSVKSVAPDCFSYNRRLKTLTISEGVEVIDDNAFYDCEALVSVAVPGSVKSIGYHAFTRCPALESVVLGEGVQTVGNYAFSDNDSLAYVQLPSTLASMGAGAFSGNAKLSTIVMAEGLSSIGQDDSDYRYVFAFCPSLTSVVVPEGVRIIGSEAFGGNEQLGRVTLPSTLEAIASDAFVNSDNVTFWGAHTAAAHEYATANGISEYHTVSFVSDGSTAADPVEVLCGQVIAAPDAPEKDGATFAGWYTDEACTQQFVFDTTPVCDDMTLYAKWVYATWNVTFVTNGATQMPDQQVVRGQAITEPEPPAYADHVFRGWYTDEACTVAYRFGTPLDADLILYALWSPDVCTVTFHTNGADPIDDLKADYGSLANGPQTPTLEGQVFTGWYTDEACTQAFTFPAYLTGDVELYAGWQEAPEPEPDPDPAPTIFVDVFATDWFYGYVGEASSRGLMSGYEKDGAYTGYFGPSDSLTRGQVATILWRAAGCPAAQDGGAFEDVPAGEFYSQAVSWCSQMGIVTGYKAGQYAGMFRPDAPVSREELAVMAYRFATCEGADVLDAPSESFEACIDTQTVSAWSHDALVWCAAAGVLEGKDTPAGRRIDPQEGATRAQAAKVFVEIDKITTGEREPYAAPDEGADADEGAGLARTQEQAQADGAAEQAGETPEQADEAGVTYEEVSFGDAAAAGSFDAFDVPDALDDADAQAVSQAGSSATVSDLSEQLSSQEA